MSNYTCENTQNMKINSLHKNNYSLNYKSLSYAEGCVFSNSGADKGEGRRSKGSLKSSWTKMGVANGIFSALKHFEDVIFNSTKFASVSKQGRRDCYSNILLDCS